MRLKGNVPREYREPKACLEDGWTAQEKKLRETEQGGVSWQRGERRKWEKGRMALSRLTDN